MKELSIISKSNNWDYGYFSRHLFKNLLFGTTVVAFLSNTSPVYAKKFDIIELLLQVLEKATAVYSQGNDRNVFSAYDYYAAYIGFFDGSSLSKSSYLTVLSKVEAEKINASEDYGNFLINAFSERSDAKLIANVLTAENHDFSQRMLEILDKNKKPSIRPQLIFGDDLPSKQFSQNGEGAALINVFDSLRDDNASAGLGKARMARNGIMSRAKNETGDGAKQFDADMNAFFGISPTMAQNARYSAVFGQGYNIGVGMNAGSPAEYAVLIGYSANATASKVVTVGAQAGSFKELATSVGYKAQAYSEGSIAIGAQAQVTSFQKQYMAKKATAIGLNAEAWADNVVALGSFSFADTAAGVAGYVPFGRDIKGDQEYIWKSTVGAVSIGNVKKGWTRQIVAVAAGTEDTDAVNLAQLKAVESSAGSWQASVNGKDNTIVSTGKMVDFSAGSNNLAIINDSKNNGLSLKFDLAKEITLDKITAGASILDATGLIIASGPKIITGGIDAGGKKITNVATGTADTDAVNFAQLKTFSSGSGSKDSLSDWSKDRVRIGVSDNNSTQGSVVIGKGYNSLGTHGTVFDPAKVLANLGIAIGTASLVEKGADKGVAIGERAEVKVAGGIALGNSSIADVQQGLVGYDPKTGKNATSTGVEWKSSKGAFSIGKGGSNGTSWTRQIIGVAAGTNDTDAVNVAQLKALRGMITGQGGWKLSIGAGENIVIGAGDTLNFTAGSTNFSITKGDKDNNVKFDLAKEITLNKITAGASILNATGLVITGGPQIITGGINAGGKKITNVATGTNGTDAVNFAQLKKLARGWKINATSKDFTDAIANREGSIAFGVGAKASGEHAIALGTSANASNLHAIAVGYSATSGSDAIAIGTFTKASGVNAIAIGWIAEASGKNAIAIGYAAKASVEGGISLGTQSVADVAAGVFGYVPSTKKESDQDNSVWRSNYGAVSIGGSRITRQIIGVAAGTNDTDAVNVAQMKSLQEYVDKGWKLSVGGENSKSVGIDSAVDFSAGGTNLNITKGKDDNNVKFDLAEEITLNKITAGASILDATGLVITGGPKITTGGIDAGGKKITGVANGADGTDAVNFSQLKELKEQVAANSFVKQDPETKHITIGKDTDGTIINLQNKNNGNRTISGVMGGEISKDSIEAVNGSQLYETNDKVATYFGGGARYEGGTWNAPTFNIKTVKEGGETENKEYHDVAEALTGVSTSITNVQNKFTKQINDAVTNVKGDSLVKWNDETKLIKIGEEKEGSEIDITNKHGDNRTIFGVKPATKDNEAVNFSQLKKIEKEIEHQVAASSFVKQNTETQHITIGKDTVGDKIDIANKNNEKRTLTGIKDAALSEESKEAVTGSQLFTTNNDVTMLKNNFSDIQTSVTGVQTNLLTIAKNTSQYLGGNADVLNGKAPTYTVEDKSYNDVASAFSGVSHSFTEVKQKITNVNNSITNVENQIKNVESDSLVKQDEHTQHITIGKDTEGDKIDITNKSGEKRTLTGIKECALSKDSNEAVTGSQLFTTNQKVDTVSTNLQTTATNIAESFGGNAKYQDGKWVDPTFTLKTVNGEGKEEDKTYKNVAEALTGVGTSFTNVQNKITKEITNQINSAMTTIQGESLVKKDEETNNINIGQEVEGGAINITDSKSEKRILTGIKDGTADADAVNFSQLEGVKKEIKEEVKEVQEQVTASSFVKQDAHTQHITIGKDTDGDKIDIANNKSEKRTLTGIKEGALSKDSNEAVTGSQLFTTDQKVDTVSTNLQTAATSIAKSFGGSAKYENGQWSAPTFTLKTVKDDGSAEEKIYNNVTEALSGVGTSFTNVQKQITEQINHVINKVESENLVKQEEATNNITIGAQIEGSIINIANKTGEDRTLSGVKEATKGNEAVNKGQLDTSIKEANNEITNKFNGFTEKITHITQKVKADALLWSDADKAFIADHGEGSAKTNSKITHLLDGGISSRSKDAITGSQLYSLGNAVSVALGGGASYEEGSWIAPTFTVNKFDIKGNATQEDYKNVADALSDLSTSLTNTQNKMTNEIAHVKDERLVKQDDKTNFIMVGGEKDGTVINIANKDKEDRRLSGVQAAENANEAVNKAQLDKLDKKIESTNSFAVFYDKQSDDTVNYKSVTFGGKNKEPVALHNVADGALLQESHDAINGGQITKIFQQVVKYFGGNAAFKEGIFTGPIYKLLSTSENGTIEETEHDSIVSAFEGLDDNIKNVNKRIKEVSQGISNDSLLWDKNKEAFVALHGEGETRENSKITYLKAGDIAANSSDAVNGSQLYSLNEQLATYFGGGAGYDKQGNWQAPNFKIKQFGADGGSEEKSYSNISDALSGVGNSFMNIKNEITKQINHLQSEDSAVVHYDKIDDKNGTINYGSLTFGGKDKTLTALHNVADGKVADESHDAVTGGQINSISQDVAKLLGGEAAFKDGTFTGPSYKLSQVDEKGEAQQAEFKDVGSAFAGIDKNIKNVNDRIKEVSEGVAQDSLSWSKDDNAFSAQHGEGKERKASKITHILDGNIVSGSTDAVTGGQLYSLNEQLATYFGGGAGYDQQGNWQAPNFKFKQFGEDGISEEKSYSNISDALSGVGNSFTNIQNKMTNEISKIERENLVKQDEKTKRITIGGERDGSEISIANSASGVRSLSGVKAGLLTAESMEAINGSQLYSVINVLSRYFSGDAGYKDGQWLAPNFKVAQFTADGVVSKKENYTNVASAFESINESMTNINNRIHDVEQSVFSSGLNWSETEKAFDARHKGQDSKIKHIADGEISEGSKEAVNGSQLWKTNKKVEEVESHVNIIDKQVKDIASVADIAVKYDKGNDGKKKNKVTLVGVSESDPVLIDNVADGRIESGSKEAVTGGQLHDYVDQQMKIVLDDANEYTDERFSDIINHTVNNVIHETKSYTDIKFEALRYELKEVRKESRRAAAIGLAVSNLSYEDTPGSLSLSIGTGRWRNQSAFAVGAGYMSENGRIRSNISATGSGKHWGIGAGLRVKLN